MYIHICIYIYIYENCKYMAIWIITLTIMLLSSSVHYYINFNTLFRIFYLIHRNYFRYYILYIFS